MKTGRTVLPLKLITGIVADEIYNHLEENYLLPEEQQVEIVEVQTTSC